MGLSNGDYINANYVNMEIPGSGIINRYIATQGPLSSTVTDFWQMVLEAGSTLVVMLTTLIERGRAKCHQYWPGLEETLTLRNLTLQCTSETVEDTFVFREFVLTDTNVSYEMTLFSSESNDRTILNWFINTINFFTINCKLPKLFHVQYLLILDWRRKRYNSYAVLCLARPRSAK